MTVPIDLDRLAEIRDQVFRIRKAQHEANRWQDPRLTELFLDRTLWGPEEIRVLLGYAPTSISRISTMRNRTMPLDVLDALTYQSGKLPTMDASLGTLFGRPNPGIEAGRVRESLFLDHRILWSRLTGQFRPNTRLRVGAVSKGKATRGHHEPRDVDRRRMPRAARKDPAGE